MSPTSRRLATQTVTTAASNSLETAASATRNTGAAMIAVPAMAV